MRFFLPLVFLLPLAYPQTCAPRALLRPADAVTGSLDETNCRLSDGSPFTEYSLTLPTRGEIQLEATSSNFDARIALRDALGHAVATGATVRQAVERGNYVVIIGGATPAQSGQFQLTTAFTPEPRTLCRDYPRIGLNQAVSGRLTASSCHLPDNTAYDGYVLRSFGSGTLEISMQSDEISPYLIVRGENGHALASGNSVSLAIDADQTYTIITAASDSAAAGQYRLALAFTPADDETCRALQNFKNTGSHQGTISSNSCTFSVPGADSPSLYNYYEIQVTEAGVADIRLSSKAFALYLLLLDETGATVQWDAGSGGAGLAVLHEQLNPGKYTVMAFSLGGVGEYTLDYRLRVGLPEICPARSLDAGQMATGALSEASCRTQEGISDVYRIDMPSAGTLDLAMTSTEFIPLLSLRDTRDNRIVTDDNFGNFTNSHITADLPAGTYTLVAGTGGAPGAYTFTYQITPHSLAPCTVQKAAVNSAFLGVFNAASCRGPNGQPIDYYEITTPANGSVAAVMTSPVLDSFVSLQTTDGRVLRWDSDSFGFPDAIVTQFLPGQTYRVAARAADAITTGYYRLDLVYLAGDRPAGCAPLQNVSAGDVISGTLNIGACQYTDDTFADIYQLDLSEITALDVRLESQDFDAYFQVLDAKGNVVAEDDNSAGGTNAQFAGTLEAGTYYIVSKPFAEFSSLGKYTLRIALAE